MSKTLVSGFLILMSFACSNKISPSKTSKNETPVSEYSEDLSVFRPKYNFQENQNKDMATGTSKTTEKPNVSSETSDQNAEVEKVLNEIIEANKKNTSGRGYRIQVFSGNIKADFENAKNYLLRNFEELEIYESYSQPTYMIKVGDFAQISDAERYQKELKGRFSTTRIVGDKINLKKALNIK